MTERPPSEAGAADCRHLTRPLFESKGWMKLIGVTMIVYGALSALTIVGIIFAWLPIWVGATLLQSASAAERAHLRNDHGSLLQSMQKLRTFFTINGVLVLVGLVLVVGSVLLVLLGVGMGRLGEFRDL